MSHSDINLPTPEIEKFHAVWKRARDFIAGEYAVKSELAGYLPRLVVHDPAFGAAAITGYRDYLKRSPFFPASGRILDGMLGMVFRKPITCKAPTALEPLLETITEKGWTTADLTEKVVREVFTTNFAGLLVDHPVTETGISRADAEKSGARPYVRFYLAESILEVTPGVINNQRKIVRARVLDNEKTVREMVLENGVYKVIIHDEKDGVWTARPAITPLRNGKAMNEIPFRIASTEARALEPTKAVMEDVVNLNAQLFLAQANSANALYFFANPMLAFYGVQPQDMKVGIGTAIFFADHTRELPKDGKYIVFSGEGQTNLDAAVVRIKDELSAIGCRIIAPDTKAGVESAEALTIRKANEQAVLSSQTNTIQRTMSEVVNDFADYASPGAKVEFEISTDFEPTHMSVEERKQTVAEWMVGFLPHQTGLELYKKGEILSPDADIDALIAQAQKEAADADRPLNTPANDVSE